MPATSQLDWLISITAISVLFSSRAASDRLSACPGAGRGRLNSAAAWGTSSVLLQRRWCHSLAARPIASLALGARPVRSASPRPEAPVIGKSVQPLVETHLAGGRV